MWPAGAGLLAAGDLLSAPSRGRRSGQRGGQGEGPRHLQQAASPAAAGGHRPTRTAGTAGMCGLNFRLKLVLYSLRGCVHTVNLIFSVCSRWMC